MTNPQSFQWEKLWHDGIAASAAVFATLSVHAIGEWLQVIVLLLTIVFLSLGIVMRFKKINSDDPTSN